MSERPKFNPEVEKMLNSGMRRLREVGIYLSKGEEEKVSRYVGWFLSFNYVLIKDAVDTLAVLRSNHLSVAKRLEREFNLLGYLVSVDMHGKFTSPFDNPASLEIDDYSEKEKVMNRILFVHFSYFEAQEDNDKIKKQNHLLRVLINRLAAAAIMDKMRSEVKETENIGIINSSSELQKYKKLLSVSGETPLSFAHIIDHILTTMVAEKKS